MDHDTLVNPPTPPVALFSIIEEAFGRSLRGDEMMRLDREVVVWAGDRGNVAVPDEEILAAARTAVRACTRRVGTIGGVVNYIRAVLANQHAQEHARHGHRCDEPARALPAVLPHKRAVAAG